MPEREIRGRRGVKEGRDNADMKDLGAWRFKGDLRGP